MSANKKPWRWLRTGPDSSVYVVGADVDMNFPATDSLATCFGEDAEQVATEIVTAANDVQAMRDLLAELHAVLMDHADVDDGEDGRPRANWCMRAAMEIERLLPGVRS